MNDRREREEDPELQAEWDLEDWVSTLGPPIVALGHWEGDGQ
jgi:hypothetical protein